MRFALKKPCLIYLSTFIPGLLALAGHAGAAPATPATPATVTIVVPFAAGGPADRIAHDFAAAARRYAPDQNFVVENVGGGGGTLGAAKVATSPTDGSVLLLQNIATGAAPSINKNLPYNTLEDFEYIGMLQSVPMVLMGRADMPQTFGEIRQLAQHTRMSLAHAGIGSASHLCGLLIQRALGRKFDEHTYLGNGPATTDLLAGKVDLLCDATNSAAKQIDAQTVVAYGITHQERLQTKSFREIPTFEELGLTGVEFAVWFGLAAPKGTPQTLLDRHNQVLRAVVADTTFATRQEAAGAVLAKDDLLSPKTYKQFVALEIRHWAPYLQPAAKSCD